MRSTGPLELFPTSEDGVDNSLYDTLGSRWYEAEDDPVALLRAESRLTGPWVEQQIARHWGGQPTRVLDVGCGGGFLSNRLAQAGHYVVGVDLSESSLEVARRHDATGTVHYRLAEARALPFEDGAFDVVTAMDFLEHVEEPQRVIAEAARVLAPGGLFLFHTFNRNPLSWLVVIKLVEWVVPNTPPNMHVLRLFITPQETRQYCALAGLHVREWRGTRARLLSPATLRLLLQRRVPPDFSFQFTRSLALSYVGLATRGTGP